MNQHFTVAKFTTICRKKITYLLQKCNSSFFFGVCFVKMFGIAGEEVKI